MLKYVRNFSLLPRKNTTRQRALPGNDDLNRRT
jgi:hypothetical protein